MLLYYLRYSLSPCHSGITLQVWIYVIKCVMIDGLGNGQKGFGSTPVIFRMGRNASGHVDLQIDLPIFRKNVYLAAFTCW